MTCIVGIVHEGRVYVGGDAMITATYSGTAMDADASRSPKVFKVGGVVIGWAGSPRLGQLLEHALTLPPLPSDDSGVSRWMAREFVDAVRACTKDGGHARNDMGEEQNGGAYLVGVASRLFQVNADYSLHESTRGYDAAGTGRWVALGALAVLSAERIPPRTKLTRALHAAASVVPSVGGPFTVLSA
jgi:ATP-dependent protease HslVU (ClpYQ) peptidase subunit